ncbi:MAG: hypothetical protein HY787_19395 [Deltaproteobacteria bacterium]|nr:hypothetical protein [Deltaproteobacteria bacterium]
MPKQSKSILLLLPFFFLFLLIGCAKKKVAYKPPPIPLPQGLPLPEFPGMRIEVNGQKISPLVPTLFLLPGDPLVIRIQTEIPTAGGNQFNFRSETEYWSVFFNGNPMKPEANNRYSGTVPKDPGFYPLKIISRQILNQKSGSSDFSQRTEGEKTGPTLLVIVLHPFSRIKNGFLDQYPLGFYPNPEGAPEKVIPKTARSCYLPPKGFIEVTNLNREAFLSQHYRLQDFICHLSLPFPQFIALSPALLLKLEWMTLFLKHYSQNPEARLTILSGFRPPRYNQSVSGALWSRHIYGDAADIIVDLSPKDNRMDDLNRDGRLDRDDLMVLFKFIEEIEIITGLPGGVGIFDRGRDGPSIHIDTRGFKARW